MSFTDSQLRAGTYIPGGPKPPFTPGYELVGVVEELGPGCSRLKVGDRIGALTVWGADAERVCVPEAGAVEVPEDLDPAEVLSLVFTYMTAYQVLHRTAMVKRGETLLVHGAAGRVGIAMLELAAVAGLRVFGTASARDREKVERLGAVAIDYRNEDFLARVREMTGDGVDVVSDSLGGPISLRSFRVLRPGGRLVVFGRYNTLKDGHKDWPAVFKWYAVGRDRLRLGQVVTPPARHEVPDPEVPRLRSTARRNSRWSAALPEWFQEDFRALLDLLRRGEIHRSSPSACRSRRLVAPTRSSRARRRRASSCSCHRPPSSRYAGCSDDEREDDDPEEHALGAVNGDADPCASVALRRVGEDERIQERRRHHPWNVEVICGEQQPVDKPVAASEGAVHARKQEPAEEQLLSQDGVEHEPHQDQGVPTPGAAEEGVARVRVEERGKSRSLGPVTHETPSTTANARISGSGSTTACRRRGRSWDCVATAARAHRAASPSAGRAARGPPGWRRVRTATPDRPSGTPSAP